MKRTFKLFLIIALFASTCYGAKKIPVPGANRLNLYIPLIEGKNIGIVANQTSMIGERHLVDSLLSLKLKSTRIIKIFAPEHGFRDLADAGKFIPDSTDPLTGLPVVSIYGDRRKPTPEDLKGLDIVLFDIQDVGARFYTYISTLTMVMEACAENKVRLIVLDRPDPNGFYFDGNIPDPAYKSFVGMHPVPIVHGMTTGEYAGMVNGEGWLKGGVKCDLTVITCNNYTHKTPYEPPVKPSPNLPNLTSVYLYPSICFFEGTVISVGRGTLYPFQVFGSPDLPDTGFSFTPESMPGAKNPLHLGEKCYGTDLRDAIKKGLVPKPEVNLNWIIEAYKEFPDRDKFFNSYFDVLAGGPVLREQIQKGLTAKQIRASWRDGLKKFGKIREKYLLYK